MPAVMPSQEDRPGVDMPPPLYFVGPLVACLLIEAFVPTRILAHPWGWIVGAVLLLAGLALAIAAARTQRRAGTDFRPDRPSTRIVSHGVYGRTRNPIYLGFALATTGIALLANSLWALAAVPIGIALVQTFVIAREERYLERKFGEEYLAYKRRVRRWL